MIFLISCFTTILFSSTKKPQTAHGPSFSVYNVDIFEKIRLSGFSHKKKRKEKD